MKLFKQLLSLLSVICLLIIIVTQNVIVAVMLLALASMRLGIMLGEGKKKNGK